MNKSILISSLAVFLTIGAIAQVNRPKEFKVNEEWLGKIEKLAPENPEVNSSQKYKVLVFDLITGYVHWNTPHIDEVIKILGDKSGAFQVEVTSDIFAFEKRNLKNYNAIVLNNNCPVGPRRNIFLDVLDKDESFSEDEKNKIAVRLEANIIKYVEGGGGLVAIHGGATMQIPSIPFSEMLGGSFDYHPPQQEIAVKLADPDHRLLKAFNGNPFIHIDEPYLFKNAYEKKNFRPLLYMNASELKLDKELDEEIKYVSWIKKHGKGRVFYSSLSHNAQSFEDTRLLKFLLDGIQYTLGVLECEDTPGGFVN